MKKVGETLGHFSRFKANALFCLFFVCFFQNIPVCLWICLCFYIAISHSASPEGQVRSVLYPTEFLSYPSACKVVIISIIQMRQLRLKKSRNVSKVT